jgi:5-methylcytosine-specific restriction endonuclease McrA
VECFGRHRSSKDGLDPRCRACETIRSKAYRKANPEKESARKKAYREANLEKEAARYRAHREANLEKLLAYEKAYREANREKLTAKAKAWAKDNPEKRAANAAKRRAAKLQRTPPWLTQQHHDQIASMYAERTRLNYETGIDHHVDHIVPLQGKNVCGLHVPWNLQVLTATENIRKSNKH